MHESRPVIALDFPSFEEVKAFLALFPEDETLYVKIGMELYYAVGLRLSAMSNHLGTLFF